MNREAIYAANFALVAAAAGLVTMSRTLKHWSDVPASQRPALFQAQVSETATQQRGMPTKWLIKVKLYVYVSTAGASSPGAVLNPIIDAISARYDNDPAGHPQTLGGLAHYARIDGTIETFEGTLGDDEVAFIPIEILVSA